MDTRRASSRDRERIAALLEESGLPPLPSAVPLSNIVVALDRDVVVGAIALEVYGRCGLLRSLVVAPERRRQGIGSSLVRSLIARCHELGLHDLYLLTESDPPFFESAGFASIERSELPQEIRSTRLVRQQCPDSTPAMRYALATRW